MRVFIGCSASNNIPKKYMDDCSRLIEKLMLSNDLVFGACHSGLMRVAHDVAKENDREVIGICPERYISDFDSLNCDEELVTHSVGERTEMLIDESDALVFLPGGIGTVHEFFTAVECKKCHEFDKPIVLYNSNGFYNELIGFMNKQLNENFFRESDIIPFVIKDDPYDVLDYINTYESEGQIFYNKTKVRSLK